MNIRRAMPVIHTADLAASRAMYVDLLGFEVGMDEPGFLMLHSATVPTTQVLIATDDCHDAQIALADVSIEVDDVDAVHDQVLAQGMEIVHPLTDEAWGIRRFFVRDPNGVVLNIAMHR